MKAIKDYTLAYTPHDLPSKQRLFHSCEARIRFLVAGIKGGKTTAGANESIFLCGDEGRDKLKRMGVKLNRDEPVFGWIVAPSYPMIRDINIKEIFKWLPKETIASWSIEDKILVLKNGASIQFKSAEQPETLRGVSGLHFIWLDEAAMMPKNVFEILLGRLTDRSGILFATTTPKGKDNWVYKEIFHPWELGRAKNIECFQYKTIDNPTVSMEFVEDAKSKMSLEFFKQEYEASFEYFVGLVYKDFKRSVHVYDPKEKSIAGLDFSCFRTVDFGYKDPFVCLFIAVDTGDNVYIFREYYKAGEPLEFHAKEVLQRSSDKVFDITYADPQRPDEIHLLNTYGIPSIMAKNNIKMGINAVTTKLKQGKLFISSVCEHTISEFETYSWARGDNPKDIPEDANNHALDALKNFLLTYHPPKPPEPVFPQNTMGAYLEKLKIKSQGSRIGMI